MWNCLFFRLVLVRLWLVEEKSARISCRLFVVSWWNYSIRTQRFLCAAARYSVRLPTLTEYNLTCSSLFGKNHTRLVVAVAKDLALRQSSYIIIPRSYWISSESHHLFELSKKLQACLRWAMTWVWPFFSTEILKRLLLLELLLH